MDWQIGYTLAVVVLALGAMVRQIAAPDLVLMAALFGLAAAGILSAKDAFLGFPNPPVPTIGALFVVSAALRETGALDLSVGRLLGTARGMKGGALRVTAPVMGLSAFLNNAPIVAMMTPTVIDWSRRRGFSPSRFLIPLSYASIMGSANTVIGTSINITIAGLIYDQKGMAPMGFFELARIGVPVCLIGLVYLVFVVPRRLPDRVEPGEHIGDRWREYTAAMVVQPDCPLVDRTVEEASLRQLPGLFLVEIDRAGRVITPVAPDQIIRAGDRLVFAGVVSTIVELQRIRGLVPVAENEDESAPPDPSNRLVEAVVSGSSPLVDVSIRDSNFRTVYDAAVIAVHRNGERVPGKIGEIVLRSGDTLLLQSAPGFMRAHGNSPDFYLVSELEGAAAPRHDRAWMALGVLGAMVALVASGWLSIAVAALGAAGVFLVTGCLTGPQARRSVDWSVLVVIGAGLSIAGAMQATGAASWVANLLVSGVGDLGPMATLIVIYVVCMLLAEMLHHNAAVAIMFPIAVATANQVGVEPRGFVMAVACASIFAFSSPVTYQTHLIVYGPGGYRFTDFVKVGLPLNLICGALALTLIPFWWPF